MSISPFSLRPALRAPGRAAVLLALLAPLHAGCGRADDEEAGNTPVAGDDDTPDTADPGNPAASPSDHLFDASQVRTYELTVAPADWQRLQDDPRAEQYVPATLLFEGSRLENIGLRYKGGTSTLKNCLDASGQLRCAKLSIKLKFSEFVPEQRFFGLKRLNFHSMVKDRSMMHDRLALWLFRQLGVPAPRASHARLRINGQDLGLFGLVEQVDGMFTRSRFADGGTGNLYKEIWPVEVDADRALGGLRTNRDDQPSIDRMLRFAAALAQSSDAEFMATLGQWTSLERFLAFLAVERAVDHLDGLMTYYCWGGGCYNHNFYWYEAPQRDHMELIAWDYDQAFQVPNWNRDAGLPDWTTLPGGDSDCAVREVDGSEMVPASCDPLLRRVVSQGFSQYAAAAQRLADGPLQTERMLAELARWEAQIDAAVASDPTADHAAWRAAMADLRGDLPVLRERFLAELATGPR
jgi:hypothetical protein